MQFKYYFFLEVTFTFSTNTFAGLKAGMLCSGIMMVVFFEMFLPVFLSSFLNDERTKSSQINVIAVRY